MAVSVREGTRLEIIAAAAYEGSPLMRMMTGRDHRTATVDYDPRTRGIDVGSWLVSPDNELFIGRVVSITDNGRDDPDDWMLPPTPPTEWCVTFERPWNQVDINSTIGHCSIEWMEDEMFPRLGTVISSEPGSHFRRGDIVRRLA